MSKVRHSESRRPTGRRIPAAFATAVIIHAGIFLLGGLSFVEKPSFGVRAGTGSVEIDLVAGGLEIPEASKQTIEASPVPVAEAEIVTPEPVAKPLAASAPAQAPSAPGNSDINAVADSGAQWAKPEYLRNRPPAYPEEALRRGWEGRVVLMVEITERGSASSVAIDSSSGHEALDRNAARAVRAWKFRPARVGGIAVPSRSRVPINFRIKDKSRE